MFKYLLLVLSLFILGCSTDEGPDLRDARLDNVKANVAEDASVSATYDSDNSGLVVDGDSTTSNYWSGNIPGDSLTIDLGEINKITEIVVYTSEMSVSTVNPPVTYELSPDGVTWSETLLSSGGDIPCAYNFAVGAGIVVCEIERGDVDNSVEHRYFRITVNSADVGLIQFYEVEITGWEQVITIID